MADNTGHWAIGLAIAVAINVFNVVAGAVLGEVGIGEEIAMPLMLAPGLTQLVWILPITFFLLRAGRKRTVWGLLISAGIVFLLNGACWGIFFTAITQM